MAEPAQSQPPSPDASGDEFRWQTVFQRSSDALFLLTPRRRIAFVNRAWEALTGLTAREARGLQCRRRTRDPAAPWAELVQNALAPPPEALAGQPAQVRRLLPAAAPRSQPQWWAIHFFPLAGRDASVTLLGKVTVVPSEGIFQNPPLPERIIALRERRAGEYRIERLQSDLPSLRLIADQVRLAVTTRVPVLLLGEPGTGKHWLARLIHHEGANRDKAFLRLDCARLPASVLEGMFGGVSAFLLASAGTIYFEEVAHLPREQQDRLGRWLASLEQSGPRILAGLSADPQEQIRSGRLLPELHCALSPLAIALPPLRDRLADLPQLVQSLLQRAAAAGEQTVTAISAEALEVLRAYRWPGNLRELYQVLVSACGRAKGARIDVADLPFYVRSGPTRAERVLALDSLLEQVERRLITLALRMAQNNKSRAAELLSVWRPRLLRRIDVLGIKDE